MTKKGIASFVVVRYLISDFEPQHWLTIIHLAVKLGLLAPIPDAAADQLSRGGVGGGGGGGAGRSVGGNSGGNGANRWRSFVVPGEASCALTLNHLKLFVIFSYSPNSMALAYVFCSGKALLPVCPLEGSGSRLLNSDWTLSSTSTCFFVFTTSPSLMGQELITSDMLKHEGFLPSGLFERLLARGCTWSQKTSSASVIQQLRESLFKDVAVLPYGAQRVRLRLRDDINCIEMNVEGHNPLGAYHRVKEQISVIINECMQSLLMFVALEIPTSSSYFVSFEGF